MLATQQPTMLVGQSVSQSFGWLASWSVSWLVDRLVSISFFSVSGVFVRLCITAPTQMLELTCLITAPAHPHATLVAVYSQWTKQNR